MPSLMHALLLAVALCAADAPPTPAPVVLDFDETPWPEAVEFLADRLGLSLQMDTPPPGKLTYADPKPVSADEAFTTLHRILLDRGFTLVRRDGALVVLLLADSMQVPYARSVTPEELAASDGNEFVTVALPVRHLTPEQLGELVRPMLSPRGQVAGTGRAGRLVVHDRADAARRLQRLIAQVDGATASDGPMRTFQLEHASADDVAGTLSELFRITATEDPLAALLKQIVPDFQKIGQQLGSRKMVEALVPGLNMKGVVPDVPSEPVESRISVDVRRNSILLVGEPPVLAAATEIVQALDRPDGTQAAGVVSRAYQVEPGTAEQLAERLRKVLGGMAGVEVRGVSAGVIVRATPPQHEEIGRTLASIRSDSAKVAALPVYGQPVKELVAQLQALYRLEKDDGPTVEAEPITNHVIVRGTAEQIARLRELLIQMAVTPR